MKCNACGFTDNNPSDKFCTKCGAELNNNIIESNVDENNKSTTFLIIGIFMAFLCSLPFGAAVILLNELKYKKLLSQGMIKDANKIKTIMIVLVCVGFVVGLLSGVLSFVLELLSSDV